MKWVPGFCPERVFGGAGEGPHVQTNAMLAPSPGRDFSVGNCGAENSPQKPRSGFLCRNGLTNPERRILLAQGQHCPHGGVSLCPGEILSGKCISSYKAGWSRCRNGFCNSPPVPQKKQISPVLHFCCGNATVSVFRKTQASQSLLPLCDSCYTFSSGDGIPDAFCLSPVKIEHSLLHISYTQRACVLLGARQDQSFLCHGFQQALV